MPMFAYVVKDANGKTKKEVVEALNEQGLTEKLQSEGYFIISINPAIEKQTAKPKTVVTRKFGHNRAKLEDLLILARQLATMLEAGVTLIRSLGVISEQVESKELYNVLMEIKKNVEQGKTLSSSLAQYPRIFNQFWVSLVEVGEASGTMPMILNKLTVYSEQEAAFRSTVSSALIYPGVLFFVCIAAIAFFALFVSPRFESIFATLHVTLPVLTKVMLAIFKVVKQYILLIAAGVVVFFFFMKKLLETDQGKMVFEKTMFSLPVFGQIYKLIIVERFSSQMSILVDSGVPILYALEITGRLVENKTCSMIISDIREAVREGKLLADPMLQSNFFPPMCVQMIKVGEETGELGQMLKHVAEFYQKNVETFMKQFGTLIEPVMLVLMGGIVGVIVLAMFLPLFNLSSGGGG